MFKLIKNLFFIVMFSLGLASVANAEVSHNSAEQGVDGAKEQATLQFEDDTGKVQPVSTNCGQKMTPADGGLTNELVRSSTASQSDGVPWGDHSHCACCAAGNGSIACCGWTTCCSCCATGEC